MYSVLWLNIMPFRNMLLAIFTQIGDSWVVYTNKKKNVMIMCQVTTDY